MKECGEGLAKIETQKIRRKEKRKALREQINTLFLNFDSDLSIEEIIASYKVNLVYGMEIIGDEIEGSSKWPTLHFLRKKSLE